MAYDALFSDIKSLPDELVYELQDYVLFLKYRANKNATDDQSLKKTIRKGGSLAGKLKYIANDFNATPEGFEEYMG